MPGKAGDFTLSVAHSTLFFETDMGRSTYVPNMVWVGRGRSGISAFKRGILTDIRAVAASIHLMSHQQEPSAQLFNRLLIICGRKANLRVPQLSHSALAPYGTARRFNPNDQRRMPRA